MTVNFRERAAEAIKALGDNVSYPIASKWLVKTYGVKHGVTDTTYYKARAVVRKNPTGKKVYAEYPKPSFQQLNDVLAKTPTLSTPLHKTETKPQEPSAPLRTGAAVLPGNVEDKITASDLLRAKDVCAEFGGLGRLQATLRALADLTGEKCG